jgi:glycine cleavage system H protein
VAAAESYPDELRYHDEHDWARLDGAEAALGITWFAADALGELVHFEPPEVGSSVTKDQSYGSPAKWWPSTNRSSTPPRR